MPEFWICGVDPGSKNCTLCFADVRGRSDPIFARAVGQDALQTAQQAFQVAEGNFIHFSPIVVWIEEPRGYNSRAIHQLSLVAGAVVAAAKGHSVEFISAGEWKKLVGLAGNAKKQAVRDWVRSELPHARGVDEHMADAYGIARAILVHGERGASRVVRGGDPGVGADRGGAGERRGAVVAAGGGGGEGAG